MSLLRQVPLESLRLAVTHLTLDQLIPESAPDFGRPLELLRACHEKIRQHCQLLVELCIYLESHAADADAQTTCEKIYRYFSVSVTYHHQDEEQDLFPLLLSAPGLTQDITALISKLKLEHYELDRLWLKFAPVLKDTDLVTLAIMTDQARALQRSYEKHIEQENAVLLPAADQLLTVEQLEKLGLHMKTRRH